VIGTIVERGGVKLVSEMKIVYSWKMFGYKCFDVSYNYLLNDVTLFVSCKLQPDTNQLIWLIWLSLYNILT